MAGIRLQNEGLGVVSVAKYRSCCQSPRQGSEDLSVVGASKPGYVSCLLFGVLGPFAHQVMERPGNPGKPADEPPVITGKAKKAAQLCCRCWCWPVRYTLYLSRLAAHSICLDRVAKIGDFTPQELALAGFLFQTGLCHIAAGVVSGAPCVRRMSWNRQGGRRGKRAETERQSLTWLPASDAGRWQGLTPGPSASLCIHTSRRVS